MHFIVLRQLLNATQSLLAPHAADSVLQQVCCADDVHAMQSPVPPLVHMSPPVEPPAEEPPADVPPADVPPAEVPPLPPPAVVPPDALPAEPAALAPALPPTRDGPSDEPPLEELAQANRPTDRIPNPNTTFATFFMMFSELKRSPSVARIPVLVRRSAPRSVGLLAERTFMVKQGAFQRLHFPAV